MSDDDDFMMVMRLRWYWRLLISVILLAVSAAILAWLHTKNEWVQLGLAGLYALGAAIVSWELSLVVLGIAIAAHLFNEYRHSSELTKNFVWAGAAVLLLFWLTKWEIARRADELERRLRDLEERFNNRLP